MSCGTGSFYTGFIEISKLAKDCVPIIIEAGTHGSVMEHIWRSRTPLGVEFQEGVIIRHITTDLSISVSEQAKVEGALACVQAIKALPEHITCSSSRAPCMPASLLYQKILL